MTSMVISRQSSTLTLPGLRSVNAATRTLLDAMTAAGLDDPRWDGVGPLVSAAALRLREAIGTPVVGSCVGAPPIVREGDFAAAARGLLSREARIEHAGAARDFIRLAFEATVAFS